MLEWITQINNAVNGVVWGPAGLALLFGTGLIMSVRTGFFQFRKMGYWLRHTIGAVLDGMAAGVPVDEAFVAACMDKRRIPGGALVRIRRWLCPFA